MKGYCGSILEIDLTKEKVSKKPLDENFARKYLGGVGFGYRLLWEKLRPNIDPLGPDNLLMFLLGPFNGILPGKLAVVFKSPASRGVGLSLVGGHFNAELKFAGYDGLIISGKAKKPIYLFIKDDEVEFRSANDLWGKTTHETEKILRKELKDDFVKIASIGVAGESQVYFSSIICDRGHAAGRMGAGAVMGSKNLKAIAVRGSKSVIIENIEEVIKLLNNAHKRVDYNWQRFGSLQNVARASEWLCDYPHKNWQEETDPMVIGRCDAPTLELKHIFRKKSCFSCPVNCRSVCAVRTGKYACVTEGPQYEHIAFLSGNVDVHDSEVVMYLTLRCNELGLDVISTGSVIAFAMELYQRGILKEDETEGLELKWGNSDTVLRMIDKIAFKQGKLCSILAYGSKIAAERIGRNSDYYAIQCKGTEIGAHGVRSGRGWAKPLTYATGLRGGNHNEESNPWMQDRLMLINSLVLCLFAHIAVDYDLLPLLNAITGWNMSKEEYNRIGERITNVGKAFMIREGFRREDDTLPKRFFREPLPSGSAKGSKVDKKAFEKDLDDYYLERGWDPKTSIPTSNKLQELGLADIDSELEKYRIG